MATLPTQPNWPQSIHSEAELDEILTAPSPGLVDSIATLESPLLIFGAGGKMGPTLAVLAKRAAVAAGHRLDVVAISRFQDPAVRAWLDDRDVRTIAADVLRRSDLEMLPDTKNLVYLIGMKFGTAEHPELTWAINTLAPASVAERYPSSRIVALSTGNVYPLSLVVAGGADEADPLTPLGEYSNAAVARERIFQFASGRNQTPIILLRLSYALDLRYGVLADLVGKVGRGEPIRLETGFFNAIWQGDANEMILRSFRLATVPPTAMNLTGTEILSVRELAIQAGAMMGCDPVFRGAEQETALLSRTARMVEALGMPRLPIDVVLRWTAAWVHGAGRSLNRPTHFDTRDGVY